MKTADYILGAVYYLSLLVPVGWGLACIKRLLPPARIFLLLVIVSLATETAALIMALNGIGNHLLYQAYFLIETVLLSAMFLMWAERRAVRVAVGVGCLMVLVSWLYSSIGAHSGAAFPNGHLMTESVLFATFAGYFLLGTMGGRHDSLWGDPRFWVSLGLLINFVGNMLLYSNLDFVLTSAPVLWRFHWINNSLANIIYAASFASWRRGSQAVAFRAPEVWEPVDP